jgi:hypothetical protein
VSPHLKFLFASPLRSRNDQEIAVSSLQFKIIEIVDCAVQLRFTVLADHTIKRLLIALYSSCPRFSPCVSRDFSLGECHAPPSPSRHLHRVYFLIAIFLISAYRESLPCDPIVSAKGTTSQAIVHVKSATRQGQHRLFTSQKTPLRHCSTSESLSSLSEGVPQFRSSHGRTSLSG